MNSTGQPASPPLPQPADTPAPRPSDVWSTAGPPPRHVPTLTEVIEIPADYPQDSQAPAQWIADQDTGQTKADAPVAHEAARSGEQADAQEGTPPDAAEGAAPDDTVPAFLRPGHKAEAVLAPPPTLAVEAPASAAPDDAAPTSQADLEPLNQRVLADVQRQVDAMLEYRLREALGPVLARAADALINDAREELSRTLKDIVARAVSQEIKRQRQRSS